MKRLLRVFILILLSSAILFNCTTAYAYESKGHTECLKKVLFYKFKDIDNEKEAKYFFTALDLASYLTIDQFNGYGENKLNELKTYDIKNLPSSINEINFNAGAALNSSPHRRPTHRGWDESRIVLNTTDLERWKIRKSILLNTADSIFDFKGNEKQKDSFCALIYYTHVLGDRIDDEKYYTAADIIELGGKPYYDVTITKELKRYIEILFADQKNTHKYNHVIYKLDYYDSKLSKILKSKNHLGSMSSEDFSKYQECAKGIMEVLVYNIPEMLKEERFFNEVFY